MESPLTANYFLLRILRKIKPAAPEKREASIMEIFAVFTVFNSLKPRRAIKIAIVNPIPPKNPTLNTSFQRRFWGSWEIFNFSER